MIKLAIRDDDVNFFTNPQDLDEIYQEISDFPISLAVVPFVAGDNGSCPESGNISKDEHPIGKNKKLVSFLQEEIKKDHYEILLHGITHEYKYINSIKLSEMIHKDKNKNLFDEVKRAKKYLENTLNCKINCFVPPNNHISVNGVEAIIENNMHLSGIISHKVDRKITFKYIYNYIKRWIFRAVHGYPYPGILDYGTHFELNAFTFYNKEYIYKAYKLCKEKNLSMVIYTHYWYLRDNPKIKKEFIEFIQYAIKDGAIPSTISNCLES